MTMDNATWYELDLGWAILSLLDVFVLLDPSDEGARRRGAHNAPGWPVVQRGASDSIRTTAEVCS